jgi:hypothetical protein
MSSLPHRNDTTEELPLAEVIPIGHPIVCAPNRLIEQLEPYLTRGPIKVPLPLFANPLRAILVSMEEHTPSLFILYAQSYSKGTLDLLTGIREMYEDLPCLLLLSRDPRDLVEASYILARLRVAWAITIHMQLSDIPSRIRKAHQLVE